MLPPPPPRQPPHMLTHPDPPVCLPPAERVSLLALARRLLLGASARRASAHRWRPEMAVIGIGPPAGLYEHEHALFRESFRAFLTQEVAPHAAAWERDGIVPRKLFLKAGEHGFLGMAVPEELGGA